MFRYCAILLITLFFTSPLGAATTPSPLDRAHEWVMGFLVNTAPPGRKVWYEGGQETKDEALKRYEDIAWDVVELAYSPETKPVFSSKSNGRSQTASVWLGIMLHESGFTKHVDYNLGAYGRGDSGLSWCMMQLRIGRGKTTPWNTTKDRQVFWGDKKEDIFEGYSGDEIIANRKLCIGEAHHLVRVSFKSCEHRPLLERLTSYAAGFCKADPEDVKKTKELKEGIAKSRARMSSAVKYFYNTKKSRGFSDQEVVQALAHRDQNKVASRPH